jgi:hypothetical protein
MAVIVKRLYGTDFAGRTAQTAELPRERRFDGIDIENGAEEIRSLGDSERKSALSHLRRMLMGLKQQKIHPEAGLDTQNLPAECPFTPEELPDGDPAPLPF